MLEQKADEAVVTDPALRAAIHATGLPWRVRDKATGIEMLLVPPGQFNMGRITGDKEAQPNELPAHPVTLINPYYLGRFEVTREQWLKVMKSEPSSPKQRGGATVTIQGGEGATLTIQPSFEFRDSKGNIIKGSPSNVPQAQEAGKSDPELPVLAGWSQCDKFCRQNGLRLPTEAEWEYACRGGVEAPRYGELDRVSWHRGNAGGKKHPVGGKAANGLGFHDMLGNAWEWVNDWYSEYTRGPKTNPSGPETGTSRVIRGGYFDFEAGFCRASLRYKVDSPDFGNTTGFRVARDP
jgi:formylglycine-generating enzyme required for sulfatase activity